MKTLSHRGKEEPKEKEKKGGYEGKSFFLLILVERRH